MTHNSRSLILYICDSGGPVVAYFANILAREHDGGTECAHDLAQILFLIFFDVAVVITLQRLYCCHDENGEEVRKNVKCTCRACRVINRPC